MIEGMQSGERIIQLESNKWHLWVLTNYGKVFAHNGVQWERIA